MKKIFIFIAICLLACACTQTNEDKAKELIEAELQKTMNNWECYEFVEMTKLDSTYSSFSQTQEGIAYKHRIDSIKNNIRQCQLRQQESNSNTLSNSIRILENKLLKITGESLNAEQEYQGEFNGFRTRFRYMDCNSHDAKILENRWVFFDKDLTRITRIMK